MQKKTYRNIIKKLMEKLKINQEIYVIKLHQKPKIIKGNIIILGRKYFNIDAINATFEIKTGKDKYSESGYNYYYIFFADKKEADNYILKKEIIQRIKIFNDFDSLDISSLQIINNIIKITT